MPDTPLNPDALEAGAKALLAVQQPEVSADYAWNVQFEDGRDELRNEARAAVSAYLTVAQPVVNSVPGVYDLGSPEPEGVDYVVECDEHGVVTDYLCSDAFSGYWSKTTDGTQWKGYQDGKVYMPWAELVRRVGPVKEVNDA